MRSFTKQEKEILDHLVGEGHSIVAVGNDIYDAVEFTTPDHNVHKITLVGRDITEMIFKQTNGQSSYHFRSGYGSFSFVVGELPIERREYSPATEWTSFTLR